MATRVGKNRLFLLAVLLPSFLFAQSNYQPAIIINKSGDSLAGRIDYRNWKNNPQTITFINAANEKQELDANGIKGFYIPAVDEVYASFAIDVDMRPDDPDLAIAGTFMDSPVIGKKAFLLQLIRHPALSLYQFTYNNKAHFYYTKEEAEPVELIHHYTYNEATRQVNEVARYKEQLTVLFSDCQAMRGTWDHIAFKKKVIQQHFLKYLQCKGPPRPAVAYKVADAVSTKFGILAGLMATHYSFKGSSDLVDDNYRSSVSPALGISLDIGLPRSRNKWHLVNELLYKSHKTSSYFTRPYNVDYTRTSAIAVEFSYVQLNSIFRYVYQSGASIKPYINIGVGNGFIMAENKNSLHTVYSFGRQEDGKAFDGPNKYEFSLLGGAGFVLHRCSAEVRYGGSKKSFSPFHSLDVNTRTIHVLFTYRF